MWTSTTGLILCLCLLGCNALLENHELASEDEKLSDFYNLLDEVDDSNLGEVENVISGNDDVDDDIMLVDPPAVMEEDLPAIQLEDDDDADDVDDDDDIADVDTPRGRRKGGRKQFWKKAKKWAKKMEKGKPVGHGRRGWGRQAWRRMDDSEKADSATTGSQGKSDIGKAGRRRGGKGGHFRSKMAEMELEPEGVDDDDDDVEGDRRGGKHHAGKWKPHNRRGKHHRKGPHHRRGPPNHHRRGQHPRRGQHGWGQIAPLEKRVAMICWKLEKPQHQSFLQHVHERLNKGIDNTGIKRYRIQFVDKMQECCKNNVTREQCFVSLTHERYDNFCDNEMPLKPWAPAGPRHRNKAVLLSSTCCEHAGEVRYNCFNGSRHAPETTDDTVSTEIPEIEEIIDEPLEEEDEDELDEEEAPTEAGPQVGRRGRKHDRGRGVVPPKVKVHCCQAGKKGAEHIRGQRARASCFAAGRKFSMYRKEFKRVCGMTYGRCCIHAVRRRGETSDDIEGAEPITQVYDYIEEDDDVEDDVSKGFESERPLPVEPEVMKHGGMQHRGKHKKHHEQKGGLVFY